MNNTPKVVAARKLSDSLTNALDFAIYLDSHPNEDNALESFADDLGMKLIEDEAEEMDAERWDGLS
jgi:hypothetical protein